MSVPDRFVLVGVGGMGGRLANFVAQGSGGRLSAVAIDTDFGAVAQLGHCQQLRIGRSRFDGAGAGGNATLARMAADEYAEAFRKVFADIRLAVVVTGLGGGTGSGVTPVLLRAARELNVRTLVFASLPFSFEGQERRALASRTCPQIDESGDVVVLLSNDDLCADAVTLPMGEAFAAAARTLSAGMTLLWRMASSPGYIGMDFATLGTLIQCGRGRALFSCASARGPQRFELALAELMDHPKRGVRKQLGSVPALLTAILGGEDLRLKEIADVMGRLQMEVGSQCDVRLGTVLDPEEGDTLSLAVLLFHSWVNDSGFSEAEEGLADPDPLPIPASLSGADPLPRTVPKTRRKGHLAVPPLVGDRFQNTNPTVYAGEVLDVPTFLRRKLRIDAE